jgi:hypothetical protein
MGSFWGSNLAHSFTRRRPNTPLYRRMLVARRELLGSVNVQPTPKILYVHDDITEEAAADFGIDSAVHRLARQLISTVGRVTDRVTVLSLQTQVDALVEGENHEPFEITLGIGEAGERVARQLDERTGWFPMVRRVDITRVEDGRGGYFLSGKDGHPWEDPLREIAVEGSIGVVDDTVFSGLTMRSLLDALPSTMLPIVRAFCLRGVADSISQIGDIVPISSGFAAPGRILDEVSFINASGLVRSVAIRRKGQRSLAFFERPEWIRTWFPGHADEVLEICRRFNRLLEPRET